MNMKNNKYNFNRNKLIFSAITGLALGAYGLTSLNSTNIFAATESNTQELTINPLDTAKVAVSPRNNNLANDPTENTITLGVYKINNPDTNVVYPNYLLVSYSLTTHQTYTMSYDASGNITNRKVLTTSPQLLGFGNYVYGSLINNNGSYHIDGSGKGSLKVLRAVYLSDVNAEAFVDQWYGMTAKNGSNFTLPKETKITINYRDASDGNKIIFSKNVQEYSGQNYSVSADKTLPGYTFSKAENESGYIGLSPVTVNYYFNKISLSDLKQNASDAIDKEAARIKDLISNDGSLSATEKATQTSNVDNDASTAKDNINKATNSDEVANAQSNGIAAIDADHKTGNLDTIKQNANDVIDQKAKEVKAAISKDNTLSATEKATQTSNVDNDVAAAKDSINKATTADAITNAQNTGVTAIEADHVNGNLNSVKDNASNSIDERAKKVKEEINNDNTLTADQKETQSANVDKDAAAAKENISKATTADDINKAESAGLGTIDADHITGNITSSKQASKDIIDEKATKVKADIAADNTLSASEKASQTAKVDKDATAAKENINEATTADDIYKAENAGVAAIDDDHVTGDLEASKKNAINSIDEKAAKVKSMISNDGTLTSDEKTTQIASVDKDAQNAKDNINAATTVDDISYAENAGLDAIDDDYKPGDMDSIKKNANDAIAKRAQEIKDAIKNDTTLTTDQKNDQTANVDKDAKAAKENIASATESNDVATALNAGISKIDADHIASDLSSIKKNANDSIDTRVQKVTGEINGDSTLTSDEKAKQIAKVTDDAKTAKDNINKASTADKIEAAEKDGLGTIDKDHVTGDLNSIKKISQDLIDNKAKDIKNEILKDDSLTTSEKESQIKNIEKDATDAKDVINRSENADSVKIAENAGITKIDSDHITGDLEAAKNNAINSIEEKAQRVKDAIDNDKALDENAKATQKANVGNDLQNAKENINKATSADKISKAEEDGLNTIDADHIAGNLDDIKNKAFEAIAEKLSNVIDTISKDNTLTADEKAEQISKVNEDAKSARNNINSATSVDEVSSAQNAGIAAIDSDYVPNDLSTIKSKAQDSIDERAAKVKDMILNDNSLSSDEKSIQTKNVEKDATKAKEKIANAQNSDEISMSESEGLSAIDADYLTGNLDAAKDKANDAIDYQAKVTKNAILEDKTLTPSEKSKQMAEVDSDAIKAKKAINEASDLDTVSSAEKYGLAAIDADHITNNHKNNGGGNTSVEQNKAIDLTQTVAVPSNVKMVELFNISNNKVTKDKTRTLGHDSCWFSDKIININGTSYLRVATNEWIKASDVYRYISLEATLYTNKNAHLFNAQGKTITNRGLEHGTAWHTDRIAYLEKDANTSQSNNNSRKYFRVATNLFVSATDVYIK